MNQPSEREWPPCPRCSQPADLKHVINCVYKGAPLKDGGEWDEKTTDEVWSRFVKRLTE